MKLRIIIALCCLSVTQAAYADEESEQPLNGLTNSGARSSLEKGSTKAHDMPKGQARQVHMPKEESASLWDGEGTATQKIKNILLGETPLIWKTPIGAIRVYGGIDADVAYMRHGAAPNPLVDWSASLITKQANAPRVVAAPNGPNLSEIGIKGRSEEFWGFSAIFDLATAYTNRPYH